MFAWKIAIVGAALLALGGCIVEPYGGPDYYGNSGYYYGGGYGGPDVGVSVGGIGVEGYGRHEGDGGGHR